MRTDPLSELVLDDGPEHVADTRRRRKLTPEEVVSASPLHGGSKEPPKPKPQGPGTPPPVGDPKPTQTPVRMLRHDLKGGAKISCD